MWKRRLWIKKLHLYIALLSALPLVVMSLSGVALVYKEAIDDFVTKSYMESPVEGQKKPIDELHAMLKTKFPEKTYLGVVLPPKEGRSYFFWIKDAPLWTVHYINPYTGEFKGERAWEDWTIANIVWWLTDIHYSFKWGKPGSYIVGVSSIILCFSILSGFFLWWPRKSKFDSNKFKPRLGKRWKQTAWNLHGVVGFWASLALFMVALTGACITFWEPMQKAVHALTFSPPPRVPPVVPATLDIPFKSSDDLIVSAEAFLKSKYGREPHAEALAFPSKENTAVEISFQGDPGLAWADHFHVYVSAETGSVISDNSPPSFNRGEKIVSWMGPIHFGTWGAIWSPWMEQVTRILWILIAASPLFLIISGLSIVKKSFWKGKAPKG